MSRTLVLVHCSIFNQPKIFLVKVLTKCSTIVIMCSIEMAIEIIETLKNSQKTKALTDQQFADRLGIHRVSWQRIKKGRVPISDKFLVRVNRIFPELGIFLSSKAINHSQDAPQNSHQTSPKRSLGSLWGWVRGFFKGAEK